MKKVLTFVLIGILLFCAVFVGISILDNSANNGGKNGKSPAPTGSVQGQIPSKTPKEIAEGEYYRISLDEWCGWQSLLDANGGLKTTQDSINAKNGVFVEYVIMNDASTSSSALISRELVAAGYTVNRYAFLQYRFDEAKVSVKMPFITNYSNGADGIIARNEIKSVNDLIGKKIAVPRFSEAQTLLEWLLRNSSLTSAQQEKIRSNIVYCDTADETAKLFFSNNVDAAATWEPYLTNAKSSTDSHVLFDTSMSTNLILDGLVFREDFMNEHPEFVTNLVKGALQAAPMYQKIFNNIQEMPMFQLMSKEEILDMTKGATLATWADNYNLLSDIAISMYRDMANIWKSLGETAYPEKAKNAFSTDAIMALYGSFSTTETSFDDSAFNSQSKEITLRADNQEALMAMTLNIQFEVDSYKISSDSYSELKEFAEVAKILNGVYIQIEGNTAPVATDDGVEFSQKRALSVAKYLQVMGIDPKRIIVVGNGDKNPIADNRTEEGKARNRRTEVFFKKVVGY